MAEHLPRPNTDAEVYLAALVTRLDKLLRLLEPAQYDELYQKSQPVDNAASLTEATQRPARKRTSKRTT